MMKAKLFLLFVAMIILFAGVTLKSSSNGATGIAVINQACADSGGFCTDAGCKGGNVWCYAPPQGGMCYTSRE